MELEEGDVVLCTVDRIVGTTVFVNIEGNGEGSIIFSEIAPGRIRNIRDYVVPKKKIVCKVLRIMGDRIDLSLRRVTQEERKKVLQNYKEEKGYEGAFKGILKEKAAEIIEKIKSTGKLSDFIKKSLENPEELEKIVGKENSEKILSIIKKQNKKRVFVVSKEFLLRSKRGDGLEIIKNILLNFKDFQIKYIAGGRYLIKLEQVELKEANQRIDKVLNEIEKKAKEFDLEFNILKK
ncbi:MAG: translation initiation factor IF-2 subunit alpha [Candidatus Pacearchaeota archaeon]|nr:MAG: translation initiation factor IF-2 subunit alpha [Candidatus Pacearchaeota archaeon]